VLKIVNGRLPVEGGWRSQDLLICDGKIAAIGDLSALDAEETWDLRGKLVIPGLIDPHVHLDDPGFTWREDFATGSTAAARGGVTTVIDMPETSLPNARTAEGLLAKWEAVRTKAQVDYAFWGGVTGAEVQDGSFHRTMPALADLGVVGFKTYTISGMETYPRVSYGELREIMKQAAALDLPVALHAEDYAVITQAILAIEQREGYSWQDYLDSRPIAAEQVAVAAAIQLAADTGAHLHIAHLSSGCGVELIRAAKARGISVTAETCPHYLVLTREDFGRWGTRMKTTPPVRDRGDQEVLWQGLQDGTIDFVATDHASCQYPREKETGSFFDAYAGIPGLETFLPLLWQEGYVKGRLSLSRFLQVTSEMAARLYGLHPRKGGLSVGADADFVVLDPAESWTIRGEQFFSQGKYTPFEGRRISAAVERTVVRGIVSFQKSGGMQTPAGDWIRRR
jgi:allantoinase